MVRIGTERSCDTPKTVCDRSVVSSPKPKNVLQSCPGVDFENCQEARTKKPIFHRETLSKLFLRLLKTSVWYIIFFNSNLNVVLKIYC